MRIALLMLVLLCVVIVPALAITGGIGVQTVLWILLGAGIVVGLVDLTDRIVEWVQRRRWPGRTRR